MRIGEIVTLTVKKCSARILITLIEQFHISIHKMLSKSPYAKLELNKKYFCCTFAKGYVTPVQIKFDKQLSVKHLVLF